MMKSIVDGTCDFLNFYKYPADMPTTGKYDIPVFKGIKLKHPEKYQLVAFDEAHLIPQSQRKKYIVHFYVYDYKFERVWTYLKKNTEWLKQFGAVIAPDFSQYTDMPRAMCIWNAWRKNFVAWWWQNEGLKVIANACWSDEKSFTYCFDGMPQNGCICVSSKGCYFDDKRTTDLKNIVPINSGFKKGLETLVDRTHPSQILWLGPVPEWLKDLTKYYNIEVIHIKHRRIYQERLDRLNKNNS